MKDALGHGSGSTGAFLRQRMGEDARMFGGPRPTLLRDTTSNAQAAQSLMNTLKSTQTPVHDAMAGRASNPTTGRAPTGLGDRISGVVTRGQSQGERLASAAWRGQK